MEDEIKTLFNNLRLLDVDLDAIINRLPDGALRDRLDLIAQVRRDNPRGPWKAILREQHGMVI